LPQYPARHQLHAGLTGWAQVNGLRGDSSIAKRLQYDLDYMQSWSLGLDAWILLMTGWAVVRDAFGTGKVAEGALR
jgi:lipopolysaccharide/colanic/teichoic acid biosynthesis glycosyltransferase